MGNRKYRRQNTKTDNKEEVVRNAAESKLNKEKGNNYSRNKPSSRKDDRKPSITKQSFEYAQYQLSQGVGIANVLFPSEQTVSMINQAQANPGSTKDTIMSNLTAYVKVADLLLWGSTNISGLITQLITKYADARGYATTLTAASVITYFTTAMKVYADILVLKRYADSSKARNAVGIPLSILNKRAYNGAALTSSGIVVNVAKAAVINQVTEASAISNAAWNNTYLSELPKLHLPMGITRALQYLFSQRFRVPGNPALHSIITMYPSDMDANISMPNAFAADVALLDAAIAANTDLLSFISFIGITNESVLSYDYQRDQAGVSYREVIDPDLKSMLVNGYLTNAFASESTDADIVNSYCDAGTLASIFDQIDIAALPLSEVAMITHCGERGGISRDGIYSTHVISQQHRDGTDTSKWMMPIMKIVWSGASTATDTEKDATLRLFLDAMTVSNMVGLDDGYSFGLLCSINLLTGITGSTVVSVGDGGVSANNNVYTLPSDFKTMSDFAVLPNWFGADYRENLQKLLGTLPYSSYSFK